MVTWGKSFHEAYGTEGEERQAPAIGQERQALASTSALGSRYGLQDKEICLKGSHRLLVSRSLFPIMSREKTLSGESEHQWRDRRRTLARANTNGESEHWRWIETKLKVYSGSKQQKSQVPLIPCNGTKENSIRVLYMYTMYGKESDPNPLIIRVRVYIHSSSATIIK